MSSKPLTDAVRQTADLFGISLSAAKMKLIEACHAGLIRAEWRGHYAGMKPLIPRQEWAGADIDLAREVLILASGERKGFIDLDGDDLEAWRTAHASTVVAAAKPTTPKQRKASRPLRDRAEQIIKTRWPDGVPSAPELPNGTLVQVVCDLHKADCAKRQLKHVDLRRDTILRAARRKK